MTDREVEKFREWLSSEEGKAAVSQASERAKEAASKRAKARQIDPKTLHEPTAGWRRRK